MPATATIANAELRSAMPPSFDVEPRRLRLADSSRLPLDGLELFMSDCGPEARLWGADSQTTKHGTCSILAPSVNSRKAIWFERGLTLHK